MAARRVGDIEYDLLPGSSRKTTDIVIERTGRVTVRAPADCTPAQVDAVVESKRLWIYRNQAEWRDLNASAVVREWVNGETYGRLLERGRQGDAGLPRAEGVVTAAWGELGPLTPACGWPIRAEGL